MASKIPGAGNTDTEICMICHSASRNHRLLPCPHVICFDCVQNMIQHCKRRYCLNCPYCRAPFTVPVVPEGRMMDRPNYVKDEYNLEIKKAQEFDTIPHKGKVMGMAILDDELFVVCKNHSNLIFKYNISTKQQKKLRPVELSISKMVWPRGMAASENLGCLFITDWSEIFGGKLWRFKYKKGEDTPAEDPVAILDVQPFGVSVAPGNDDVLVTCATPVNIFQKRGWIYIYRSSGNEFTRTRVVDLPGLEIPRHAIRTSSGLFLVCHGWSGVFKHGVTSFQDEELGTARKISFYGKTDKNGGGSGELEVERPLSMAHEKDGMIFVVDYYNHRIQLLTEDLHLVRHLITKTRHRIEYPRHVCQDSKTGRLFVGFENGNVHVFDTHKD